MIAPVRRPVVSQIHRFKTPANSPSVGYGLLGLLEYCEVLTYIRHEVQKCPVFQSRFQRLCVLLYLGLCTKDLRVSILENRAFFMA